MAQKDFCQICGRRHSCLDVYRRLGSSEGPSVTLKVTFAFLIPVLVFIVSLAAFEWMLRSLGFGHYSTPFSLVGAAATTFIAVVLISLATAHLKRKK
jgi:hypothetical protein